MPKYIDKECKFHGLTSFVLEGRGYYRCRKCRSEGVSRYRRDKKKRLIEEFGGKCKLCGYDKTISALHFHHKDPSKKDFGISSKGITRSYKVMVKEAAKCILVCANCHAEIHDGLHIIPA